MDRSYIKASLERLKSELSCHEEKFSGNASHANCSANFERAIQQLETELGKISASDLHGAEPPKQVGDGMLYNDVEGEMYDVAEEKLKKRVNGV